MLPEGPPSDPSGSFSAGAAPFGLVSKARVVSLLDAPGRAFGPMPKCIRRPSRCLIGVAGCARVGNFVLIGHRWRDETERVRMNVDIRDGRLDRRHVAINTIPAGCAGAVMGM